MPRPARLLLQVPSGRRFFAQQWRLARTGGGNGVTLIEMLVVLAIIGLVGGMALPALPAMYDRIQIALSRDNFIQELTGLPYDRYLRGKDGVLLSQPGLVIGENHEEIILELPTGWYVEVDRPIYYYHSGTCGGGVLTLIVGEIESRYLLAAPFCKPQIE